MYPMRAFLLITSFVLGSDIDATNMFPILNGRLGDKQREVYLIILHNSLPTVQLPEYRKLLSEEDLEQIRNNPCEFLTARIKQECPEVDVSYIPKSLYQLFVYYIMIKEFVESIDKIKTFNLWLLSTAEYPNAIGAGGYKWFDDLFSQIQEYNENIDVQNAFWKINDIIHGILVEKKETLRLLLIIWSMIFTLFMNSCEE